MNYLNSCTESREQFILYFFSVDLHDVGGGLVLWEFMNLKSQNLSVTGDLKGSIEIHVLIVWMF